MEEAPVVLKELPLIPLIAFQNEFDDTELRDIGLLVQCLTIIARHFDNINLIIRSNFINCVVEICHHLLNGVSTNRVLSADEEGLVKQCCEFLEVIYDPFLKWRHFLRTNQLSPSYQIDPQLRPEIVPFIYTCFEEAKQNAKATNVNAVGAYLLNVLGSITIGSAKNGRLVICPATINVIMMILGDWESDRQLREKALHNANIMLIMLLKANPVERQIELEVVVQQYLAAIGELLKSTEFVKRSPEEEFEIELRDSYRDQNALLALVRNIMTLLAVPSTKLSLCNVLLDCNVIANLVDIPEKIHAWNIDHSAITSVVVEVIALLIYSVNYEMPRKHLAKLFQGVRSAPAEVGQSRKKLVQQCLSLATNPNDPLAINSFIVNELIQWLPSLTDDEQEVAIGELMDICTRNSNR